MRCGAAGYGVWEKSRGSATGAAGMIGFQSEDGVKLSAMARSVLLAIASRTDSTYYTY